MTKPKPATQPRFSDPFFTPDTNLDLSGCPSLRELPESEASDPFIDPTDEWAKLTAENRHSLKNGVLALANGRDPEVRSQLERLGIDDPTASKNFFLASGERATAYLDNDNIWRVTRYKEDKTQETAKFPSARTREQAQTQAAKHFARNTVHIRPLSKEEELFVIRLCQLKKIQDAISNYLFFRCGELDSDPVDNPLYTPVSNECVWFVFEHLTPNFTEEARAFMQTFLTNRKVLNLDLLKAAFDAYEIEQAKAGLSLLPRLTETQEPEQIDLDSLSDTEISKLRDDSLRAYAKEKGRR